MIYVSRYCKMKMNGAYNNALIQFRTIQLACLRLFSSTFPLILNITLKSPFTTCTLVLYNTPKQLHSSIAFNAIYPSPHKARSGNPRRAAVDFPRYTRKLKIHAAPPPSKRFNRAYTQRRARGGAQTIGCRICARAPIAAQCLDPQAEFERSMVG